jgi:hypothetical protein
LHRLMMKILLTMGRLNMQTEHKTQTDEEYIITL